MSRKFWESNLIDDFNKVNISFSRFMEIYKQVSSKTPYFLDSINESEKESHFLLLLSGLTNEELKNFYNKIDIPLTEINNKYSIRKFSEHPVVFNDNGFLAQIKFLTKDNETFICCYDANNNLIEDISTSPISSTLSLEDSIKEYISKTLFKNNSKEELEFNHDKYFLRLYSRYMELTNKGIDCDIYVGTPAGHYFVSKEQLVKEFNKDDATSYMLSDAKGQCIFNKEIFEEENQYEKVVPKYYTEEYLDEKFMMDVLEAEGWTGKEIQEEIWVIKEEMKQGNAKSEYIKTRKVPNEQKFLSNSESFSLLALLKNENNEFTKDESAKAKWILENSGVVDYPVLNAELDVLLYKIKERQESDKSILSQIKEIAPNYKILTIDEYNSKLFMKIENREELESKYTKFLELELSYLQKNFYVVTEQDEEQDIDNSVSLNK